MTPVERAQLLVQLLHHLDVRKVLDYYGVDILNDKRQAKTGGVEYDGSCPFHQTTTQNFSMNSRSGKWFCRSALCGKKGDLIQFVALKEQCDYTRAFHQLCFMADIEPTSIDDLSIALASFETVAGGPTMATAAGHPSPMPLPRQYRVFPHPYFVHARLLDPDVLVAAEAGGIYHDPFYKYRACVPVKKDGKVYSIYSRRVSDDVDAWKAENQKFAAHADSMFRRHDYTGNTLVSHLLYGIDEVTGPEVILVEAIISVLRLRTIGIPNAVAMMKADISSEQIKLLIERGFSKIYICGDNDRKEDKDKPGTYFNPGLKASWRSYHKLKKYADVGVVLLPPNRDPADTADPFTREEFQGYLDKATFPTRNWASSLKGWLP